MCNPCCIKYDFIGRFENLTEDSKHVLAKLTTSVKPWLNVTFPSKNVFYNHVSWLQQRKSIYGNVSRDVLRKLIRLYKLDYNMFGYDYRWACSDC